jgi:thiol-disulfide isomerase/thioredoxin
MSKILTAILMLFAMHSTAQSLNKKYQDATKNKLVMINQCTRDSVTNFPEFKAMYDSQYPAYTPDSTTISKLKPLVSDLKVTIVLGTWCGDSKLQVPHFLKVLDQLQMPENSITLICVDGHKKSENGLTDNLNIVRVPTFIVTKNGKELGRIVESPKNTLEDDFLNIVSPK